MSCLWISCCINALNCCVHYLCLRGWIYVIYVEHIDYETLFHVVILSKHHHHHHHSERSYRSDKESLSGPQLYVIESVLTYVPSMTPVIEKVLTYVQSTVPIKSPCPAYSFIKYTNVRTRTCAHPHMSNTDVCLFGMPFQHDFIVLSIYFDLFICCH
jgi:hypothetical protein